MDGQLGGILREEREESHQFAKDQRFSHEVKTVVDAEWVEHGGQEHVLSDEGDKAGWL